MPVSRRASDLAALAVALFCAAAASAGPPQRVVSINLCTDQLAMMLAAPGQLVSVSHVATDPRVSAAAEEAAQYRVNHGQAEEVHALRPDLVLAGPYTSRYAVGLLRRLGVEVRELPAAERLEDIPGAVAQIGAWLGRDDAAEALIAEFEAGLAHLTPVPGERPRAVLHYANNYTSGAGTLADQILGLAGFLNIAAEDGIRGGGTLPMERIVMLAPDLVISGQRYPGASRAEAVLDHPAMQAMRDRRAAGVSDADWVCGTPLVLRALARLVALHAEVR
jgi:iron complex transport system substrate-binding protein